MISKQNENRYFANDFKSKSFTKGFEIRIISKIIIIFNVSITAAFILVCFQHKQFLECTVIERVATRSSNEPSPAKQSFNDD